MGAVSATILRMIKLVSGGARPGKVIEEEPKDPFLDRSLQIDDDMRTGKSRTLTVEETKRELARLKRSAR